MVRRFPRNVRQKSLTRQRTPCFFLSRLASVGAICAHSRPLSHALEKTHDPARWSSHTTPKLSPVSCCDSPCAWWILLVPTLGKPSHGPSAKPLGSDAWAFWQPRQQRSLRIPRNPTTQTTPRRTRKRHQRNQTKQPSSTRALRKRSHPIPNHPKPFPRTPQTTTLAT